MQSMKSNRLVKWMGASVLTLSLAILPSMLPASAQTNAQNDPATPGTTTTEDDGFNFDWGWLGLLGLIGLAGLKGLDNDKSSNSSSYSDRTTTPSTSNPRY